MTAFKAKASKKKVVSGKKRIIITQDEFFKASCKGFFETEGMMVTTELEIFHLPKRLDVLVIKNESQEIPEDYTLLQYWKMHNLISFKSTRDKMEESDIFDSHVYLNGFIKATTGANYENTTMTMFVNRTPRKFSKKYNQYIENPERGYWILDSNFYKVHIIDIRKIGIQGVDRSFLANFSNDEVFMELMEMLNRAPAKRSKRFDKISKIANNRISSFETDSEVRSRFMATAYKADITDLVEPYLEEREEKGKHEGKLEAARLMKAKGYPMEDILEITGLSKAQLKENGII